MTLVAIRPAQRLLSLLSVPTQRPRDPATAVPTLSVAVVRPDSATPRPRDPATPRPLSYGVPRLSPCRLSLVLANLSALDAHLDILPNPGGGTVMSVRIGDDERRGNAPIVAGNTG